jgi:outer membrane protein assembly factor BamB
MKHASNLVFLVVSLTATWLASPSAAEPLSDWPQFRGPGSRGVAEGAKPPIHFGPETNLLWKIEVPVGHSSPIVVKGRIVFNAAEGKELLTCAVDGQTGQSLWRGKVSVDKVEKFHEVNTATPCTPVSDGERIISYLPSFGLIAYDLEGHEQWQKALSFPHTYRDQGSGASPLLAGGLVIVEVPLENELEILAVKASDGSEVWKVSQPLRQMGWATPVRWSDANGESMGLVSGGQFTAYRVADGKELWSVNKLGAEACATPVVTGDQILLSTAGVQGEPANMTIPPEFGEALKLWDKNGDGVIVRDEIPPDYLLTDRKATGGKGNMTLRQMMGWFQAEESKRGYNREQWEQLRAMLSGFRDGEMNQAKLLLVRLGGQGDVTKTHVQWQEGRGVPEIPSPLVYRNRIYLVRNGGLFSCRALETGKVLFDERLGAPGGYFASPLGADGRVYVASDTGTITVVEAADQLKVLAQNALKEPVFASPATVGEVLYVRGSKHLWAFREMAR